MNKKMRQLSAGVILMGVISFPTIVLASCGSKTKDVKEQSDFFKKLDDNNSFTPIPIKSKITLKDFLEADRKLKDGEYVEVKDDVTVLADAYYTGQVQDISKIYPTYFSKMEKESEFKFIKGSAILPRRIQKSSYVNMPVIQMDSNDSLIFFFNSNNNDGRSLEGFKKQVMFQDSTILQNGALKQFNKERGFKASEWGSFNLIPFVGSKNKGTNNSYVSGAKLNESNQNNYKNAIKEISKIMSKDDVDKIISEVKKTNWFYPMLTNKGSINFEVLGPNAIKVSFSKDMKINGAKIGAITPNGKSIPWDAELSIGGKEQWDKINSKKAGTYLVIGKH
ncbi:hypothetical protein MYMA111404_02695 [Mycoplasma marinum]|uniref:Lipoprotein n=1 Tax=Mycoplasma marinum TaxID=1937190 RepID=A0A4R0XSY0_9MOLU|nr:hypothetical protein [Mycoplasma marinum]TCG10837.1 hypothetical protein C4B24_03855 [Mycoplasma marinum]